MDPAKRRQMRERWDNMSEQERNRVREQAGNRNSWAPQGK
jgi:hypothetical protein